ncbi:MAG: 23S rRNA (adenine(2503)-C(2))-methyltransferase RlmN [Phycisphaerales bacterium]
MAIDSGQLPHPLGLTSAQFVAAYRHLKGEKLDLYRALFREGRTEQAGLSVAVPPVIREHRELSPEGEVIKFVQALGSSALRAVPSRVPLLAASSPRSSADAPRVPLLARSWGRRWADPHAAPETPPTPPETESVLIPMIGRTGQSTYTLCVSSQVGCAMGCTFCETAQMGLIRSLEAHEIVAQWFAATHLLGTRPKNLVFMGMGEPMDNLDAVIQAIAVLTDSNGAAMGISRITVSTVGRVDGIRRLAEQVHKPGWHRLGLAISINAPNDDIRSAIMPVNRRYPMAELRRALEAWPRYGGCKFCIEYVLIPGVNDAPPPARQLAQFVKGLPCCVNLIPYNPRRDSPWPAPEESRVRDFLTQLTDAGAYARRRRTKGRDLMGACGQLGNPAIRRRKVVQVGVEGRA